MYRARETSVSTPVDKMRVPTYVIDVQVGADDEID
jgi:hypothetical protein